MSGTLALQPEVEVAWATDPGKDPDKQVNEDTCRYASTAFGHLIVLCDGMGGHESGREASEGAVAAMFRYFEAAAPRPDLPPAVRAREVLRDAVWLANREVYALSQTDTSTRPGSTIVAALLHAAGTEVAHVGDSRCYHLHGADIRQVTRDHSMVQGLVDMGQLTPEQAAVHPDANKITRALGMSPDVAVEVAPASIAHGAGDVFMLCSDGLSDLVFAPDIARILTASPPAEAARELVELANSRGGHDNITVVVMRARAAAARSEEVTPVLRATEQMQAVPAVTSSRRPPPTLEWPGAAPAVESHRLLPPAPPSNRPAPRLRRRPSAVVAVGMVLALVGVVAVGAIVALQGAQAERKDVPGLALSIVLPAASLAPPAPPEDDADAGVDAAPRGRRFRNPKRR